MRRGVAAAALLLMVTALALAGCGSAGSGSAGADLVSTRCQRCHPLERVKSAQHDAAGWKSTVERMRGKGAQLSDAEAQQVIEFLANGGASGL